MSIHSNLLRLAPLALAIALSGCFAVDGGPILSGGATVEGLAGDKEAFMTTDSDGDRDMAGPGDRDLYNFYHARSGAYLVEDYDEDDILFVSAVQIEEDVYVMEAASEPEPSSVAILWVDREPAAPHFYFCISVDLADETIATLAQTVGLEINQGRFGGTTLFPDTADELVGFMAALWQASEPDDWDCSVMRDPVPDAPKTKP